MKKLTTILVLFLFTYTYNFAQWTQKANFGGTPRYAGVGFSIGYKGYIGTGQDTGGVYRNDFWEYDPISDIWVQKADYPATERRHAVGFSIANKGYLGTGWNGSSHYKTFKEFDPSSNSWTSKAYFGGDARRMAVGFSIGTKAYIGTGYSGSDHYNDFWEYDPISNTWTQKADVPDLPRCGAVGFSIGSKGYIGTGVGLQSPWPVDFDDFWEYDPTTNTWTQKADFGGGIRYQAIGFSIGSKGYVGTGYKGNSIMDDIWEYDPLTDTWTQLADFIGGARTNAVGFSIGLKGYIGTGYNDSTELNDFWEFNPLGVNIQEYENNIQLSIFPNPTEDILQIISSLPVNIEILSTSGKIIESINNSNSKFNVDVTKFAKGIYFIKANNGNDFIVKKIVIQ
jgi:N-acetylneuraminic acid mutarotase